MLFRSPAFEGIHVLSVLEMPGEPCRQPVNEVVPLSLGLPVTPFMEESSLSVDTSPSVSPLFSASSLLFKMSGVGSAVVFLLNLKSRRLLCVNFRFAPLERHISCS